MDALAYNLFTQSARERLFNAINAANGTQLTEEDVVVSPPSWYHDESSNANTQVTVIASGLGEVVGQFDFRYRRQAIAQVFGLQVPTIPVTPEMTTARSLLESLRRRYRLTLTLEDIVDEPLPPVETLSAYDLKISSRSLGWHGQLTLNLVPITTVLDSDITVTQGSIGHLPDGSQGTRAELWYGARRITQQADADVWADTGIAVGDNLTAPMIESLRGLFGQQWSSASGVTQNDNLYGATIAYCGPNEPHVGVPGSVDDLVIMIALSEYCENFTGYLVFSVPAILINPAE